MLYPLLIILATCQPDTRPTQTQVIPRSAIEPTDPDPALRPDNTLLPPSLLNTLITRVAEIAAQRYELDITQQDRLRDDLLQRWNLFAETNRSQLRHLLNEFLHMSAGSTPPDESRVDDWAHRSTPLLQKIRIEFNASAANLRNKLDASVHQQFDADVARLDAELNASQQQVREWAAEYLRKSRNGGYTPYTRTDQKTPPRNINPKQPEADDEHSPKPTPVASDQILAELDAWTLYVENFVRDMDLDPGQSDAVMSILSELKQRARSHRDRRRNEIETLERAIESFRGGKEELEKLEQRLIELYGPIDLMFGELRHRIDKVPTATQKENAREQDP